MGAACFMIFSGGEGTIFLDFLVASKSPIFFGGGVRSSNLKKFEGVASAPLNRKRLFAETTLV